MALSKTFRCSPENAKKALAEMESLGANVEGNASGGTLRGDTLMGHFEGTYLHDGENLTLTITKKPPLIPESFLQGRLDDLAKRYGVA